jgi:hypothetical protein
VLGPVENQRRLSSLRLRVRGLSVAEVRSVPSHSESVVREAIVGKSAL